MKRPCLQLLVLGRSQKWDIPTDQAQQMVSVLHLYSLRFLLPCLCSLVSSVLSLPTETIEGCPWTPAPSLTKDTEVQRDPEVSRNEWYAQGIIEHPSFLALMQEPLEVTFTVSGFPMKLSQSHPPRVDGPNVIPCTSLTSFLSYPISHISVLLSHQYHTRICFWITNLRHRSNASIFWHPIYFLLHPVNCFSLPLVQFRLPITSIQCQDLFRPPKWQCTQLTPLHLTGFQVADSAYRCLLVFASPNH